MLTQLQAWVRILQSLTNQAADASLKDTRKGLCEMIRRIGRDQIDDDTVLDMMQRIREEGVERHGPTYNEFHDYVWPREDTASRIEFVSRVISELSKELGREVPWDHRHGVDISTDMRDKWADSIRTQMVEMAGDSYSDHHYIYSGDSLVLGVRYGRYLNIYDTKVRRSALVVIDHAYQVPDDFPDD